MLVTVTVFPSSKARTLAAATTAGLRPSPLQWLPFAHGLARRARARLEGHVYHAAAAAQRRWLKNTPRDYYAPKLRAVLARCFRNSLGGNWGYPTGHEIGNSGKDG